MTCLYSHESRGSDGTILVMKCGAVSNANAGQLRSYVASRAAFEGYTDKCDMCAKELAASCCACGKRKEREARAGQIGDVCRTSRCHYEMKWIAR